jgi:hypothetical protein
VTSSYLVVLSDREAIRWVLAEQRMAFPGTPRAEVAALAVGDELFLYSTRGAWHNPGRDRGRLIGHARVATGVTRLDEPIELAGMTFHSACDLDIDEVVPYPGGLELQPLVGRLSAFPKPQAWSAYLRRPLVRMPGRDREILHEGLRPIVASRKTALATYPDVNDDRLVAWAASLWPAAHNARREALHGQTPLSGNALRAQSRRTPPPGEA